MKISANPLFARWQLMAFKFGVQATARIMRALHYTIEVCMAILVGTTVRA